VPAANDAPSTEAEGDNRLVLLRYVKLACKTSKKDARHYLLGNKRPLLKSIISLAKCFKNRCYIVLHDL
jgi:hypothetical protein